MPLTMHSLNLDPGNCSGVFHHGMHTTLSIIIEWSWNLK